MSTGQARKTAHTFLVLKHGGTRGFAFSTDFEKSFPCTHTLVLVK